MTPDVGPVSLAEMNIVLEAYNRQQYLSGLMMFFTIVVAALLAAMMRSHAKTQRSLEAQNGLVVKLVEQATAAIVGTAATVMSMQRSVDLTTAEVRVGFAGVTTEIRASDMAVRTLASDQAQGRLIALADLKAHLDMRIDHVIDEMDGRHFRRPEATT